VNQKPVATPPATSKRSAAPTFVDRVWHFFQRILTPFLESIIPKPHYLEGEEVRQVIEMAGYREKMPKVLGVAGILILIPGLIILVSASLSQRETTELLASTAVVLALFLIFQAAQEWLNYNQWQFIVTNKRFILITPHPQRRGFADVIYLKGGKIQVLDTNFSKNPLWGMFQMIQGTRDVMLSMSGYEFQETGAQVKGGLRFPDVKPEDIRRLEELIFG